MTTQDKLAIGLDHGMPGAEWGNCTDYAMLQSTWRDERPVPSEAQIMAWFNEFNQTIESRKVWPNAAAFMAEFTLPELASVSLSQDPTVAALRLMLSAWPSDVWSDDPRIQMGLAALVSSGIIDETRKAELLAK